MFRWCWGHSRLPAQPPDKRLPRFAKTFKSYYTHTHIILKTERNYIYSFPSSILIPDHAPSQILFQNYLSKVVIIVTQVVVLTQKCSWRVDIKHVDSVETWQIVCDKITQKMSYCMWHVWHMGFLYLHMWHFNIRFYICTCDISI